MSDENIPKKYVKLDTEEHLARLTLLASTQSVIISDLTKLFVSSLTINEETSRFWSKKRTDIDSLLADLKKMSEELDLALGLKDG